MNFLANSASAMVQLLEKYVVIPCMKLKKNCYDDICSGYASFQQSVCIISSFQRSVCIISSFQRSVCIISSFQRSVCIISSFQRSVCIISSFHHFNGRCASFQQSVCIDHFIILTVGMDHFNSRYV